MEYNDIIEEMPFVSDDSLAIVKGNIESSSTAFIEANTIDVSLTEIKEEHIIPVFAKTNEPLISHSDFIETTYHMASGFFGNEQIHQPNIRVSHVVKGRTPDAKYKAAAELQEWEKTLYYERMMFAIDIPTIQNSIDGNNMCLTIGGVKAYNKDNLYSRNYSDQHFKIFIGFKVSVCTNLCVWTDGINHDVKVTDIDQLKVAIKIMFEKYNLNYHLYHLNKLTEYGLSEKEFAQLIGKCRMYNFLPNQMKQNIPHILFGDQQMNMVVRDYYKDISFSKDSNGNINLWKLYNLFTSSNKSSYIDTFLDRGYNAFQLVEQVRKSLENKQDCWYLN